MIVIRERRGEQPTKGGAAILAPSATATNKLGAVYGRGFAAARLRAMELITILNRCHHFRGFVYQHAHFSADKKSIEVAVAAPQGFGRDLLTLPSAGA